MMNKICGIYEIRNLINNKKYIGSTTNMRDRWRCHKKLLKKKQHHSDHLQNSWNKYNETNFIFRMIEEISDESILLKREGFFVNKYNTLNREFGYNIKEVDLNGQVRHSEETKKKISKAHKGVPQSPEVVKRRIEMQRSKSKLNLDTVKEIRTKLNEGDTQEKLAKEYGVSRSSIQQIIENKRWYDPEYSYMPDPEAKKKKLSKTNTRISQENSKLLNLKQVKEIRTLWATGNYTQSVLGEMFGISRSYIRNIIANLTWKDKAYTYVPRRKRRKS